MFEVGMLYGSTDDRDKAIAVCGNEGAPTGCEVLDTQTGEWIGPTCWQEIEEARERLVK